MSLSIPAAACPEQYGEEIMACIILKEGEASSVEEIKAFVLSHMAKHKVPRYIEFVEAFPMNAPRSGANRPRRSRRPWRRASCSTPS